MISIVLTSLFVVTNHVPLYRDRIHSRFVGVGTFDITAATSSWSCIDLDSTRQRISALPETQNSREGGRHRARAAARRKSENHWVPDNREHRHVEIRNASDVYFRRPKTFDVDNGAFISEAIAQVSVNSSDSTFILLNPFSHNH